MTSLPLFPSRSEFRDLAEKGNLIPIYTEFVADYETPIAAFEKIDNGVRSFLLESAESNDHVGRYSFLGSDPRIYFEARGKDIVIEENGRRVQFESTVDPLTELQKLMSRFRAVELPGLPPFTGGAVGYIGYDAVRTDRGRGSFRSVGVARNGVFGDEHLSSIRPSLPASQNLRERIG